MWVVQLVLKLVLQAGSGDDYQRFKFAISNAEASCLIPFFKHNDKC